MDNKKIRNIAVFCGSSAGCKEDYSNAAYILGKTIAERGYNLVYGGGGKGLMGITARAVRENGGKVIGVLPESMNVKAVRENAMETELIIVRGMHERKETMYRLSDAFIALPGGIGTLEEIAEIYTWRQLGYHEKNIGILNTAGYWNDFIALLDKGYEEGFISEEVRHLLIVESAPSLLLDRLETENFSIPPKI